MRYLDPSVDRFLDRVGTRWRWVRFAEMSATLAICVTGVVLLFGIALACGFLTHAYLRTGLLILLVFGTVFTWAIMGLVCALAPQDRRWLAAAAERTHPSLMDRLNTILFLHDSLDRRCDSYAEQIQQQARTVLRGRSPGFPLSRQKTVRRLLGFVLLLMTTIWFFSNFQPWQRAVAATNESNSEIPLTELLDIPAADALTATVADEVPWGEVRISQPGADLRVTPLDILPLRIEAAANRPLQEISWYSTVNSAEEVRHDLPTRQDPSYAVFDTELSVEHLGAEAWDVVTYVARAVTEDGHVYESELYFLEVVPFREELEDTPGGIEGSTFDTLEEMTEMIARQREVIRQTRHWARVSDRQSSQHQQAAERLAMAEGQLSEATRHLAARITTQLPWPEITPAQDELRRAESALQQAESWLSEADLQQGLRDERQALSELIAARKQLDAEVRQDADAMGDEPPVAVEAYRQTSSQDQDAGASELAISNDPVSPDAQQRRNEMEQLQQQIDQRQRDLEDARQTVQEWLLQQRDLERKANPRQAQDLPKLAEPQQLLRQSVEQFQQQKIAAGVRQECENAKSAMQRTADLFQAQQPHAQEQAGRAADTLQQLDNALEEQQRESRLQDAYTIRQMMTELNSQCAQCQNSGSTPQGRSTSPSTSPSSASPAARSQLARLVGQAANQLRQIVEQSPGDEAFGPPLRESLDAENGKGWESAVQRLEQSTEDSQQQAAGELRQGLQRIADAFDASLPLPPGEAHPREMLLPQGAEAIARGVQPLESAARRQSQGRPLSKRQRDRLGREALRHLSNGIPDVYGHNDRTTQALRQLAQRLEDPDVPLDLQTVQELTRDVRQLGAEVVLPAHSEAPAEIRSIDASRFPPDYRGAIEKYFEKLSEP